MKKIKYIIFLFCLLLCSCNRQARNERLIENIIAEENIDFANETYEYSYVTKKGEITGEYNIDEEKVVKYYSLGKPNLDGSLIYDNSIYYNPEGTSKANPKFCISTKTINGIIMRFTWFDEGTICMIKDNDFDTESLMSADHIELFKNIKQTGDIIGWFDNRLVVNAHIYSLVDGNIIRTTINENEETFLDSKCKNIKYKNGYIYYLHEVQGISDYILYRITLDGTEKEEISNTECFDYWINTNGVIYLTESENVISIKYKEFTEENAVKHIGEFTKKKYYVYRIAGVINDEVYLCMTYTPTINDAEQVQICKYINNELVRVHLSEGITNIRNYAPFVHENNIYYLTNEGLFKFDPIKQESILIATFVSGIGKAVS